MTKIYLLTIFGVLVVHSNSVFSRRILNSNAKYVPQIQQFIEDLKARMCHEIKEYNIPPLEPFELAHVPLNISSPLANIKGDIYDLRVEGLSTIEIRNDVLQFLSFQIDIAFNFIRISGRYLLDGYLSEIPIDGNGGNFKITLTNLTIEVRGGIYVGKSKNETFVQIKLKKIYPHLEKGEFQIEGLVQDYDVNKFLNLAVSQLAPDFLEETWIHTEDEVKEMVENMVRAQKLGNDFLKKFLFGDGLFDKIPPGKKCIPIQLPIQ